MTWRILIVACLALLTACDSGNADRCEPILGGNSPFPFQEGTEWVFTERDLIVGSINPRLREGEVRWAFGELTCDVTGFQRADVTERRTGIESGVAANGNPFERPYFETSALSVGVREVPAKPGRVRLELEGRLEAPIEFHLSDDSVAWDTVAFSQRESTWLSGGVGLDSLATVTLPGVIERGFQSRMLRRVE